MGGQPFSRRGAVASLASLVAAGGGVLTACGQQGGAPPAVDTNPTPSGTVEWWLLLNNAKEKEILEQGVFADYLRERPQLKLNLTVISGWDNVYAKVLGALAAGTPPEIG